MRKPCVLPVFLSLLSDSKSVDRQLQNTRSKTGEVHLGHLPEGEPERLEAFMEQAPPPFYAAPGFKAKPVI